MFPVSRKNALAHMWPAPDVIPEICRAIEATPDDVWDSASSLPDLADRLSDVLAVHGARRDDLVWQMERHFSEPFGPLPPATVWTHAGIPPIFLEGADTSSWFAVGYTPRSGRPQ